MDDECLEPLVNDNRAERILPPNRIGDFLPATKGIGKDRIRTEDKNHAQSRSPNKDRKDELQPNKNQVVRQETPKESYVEICTFEKPDSLTLVTNKNYKGATNIWLIETRVHVINCVFDNDAGLKLLRKDIV